MYWRALTQDFRIEHVRKSAYWTVLLACIISTGCARAQMRSTTLIQAILEDERLGVSIDKPVYFPGDTLRLNIQRTDSAAMATITPLVGIEGMVFTATGRNSYAAVIPDTVTPGAYRVLLRVGGANKRRIVYETDCFVQVEEYQGVELLRRYISLVPEEGSTSPESAPTLQREQLRSLQVFFRRDSIGPRMGPQFVTIRTTVQLRDGTTAQASERRVVTFRSHGTANRDRAMFTQYRTAYGPFAAIDPRELDEVPLQLEDLPGWALVTVIIAPDYTIKIGELDRSNTFTRYFRVLGPAIDVGFTLGIPQVLLDTRAEDTVEYGKTSAMVRLYYNDAGSGHRFPVGLGIGTFGVSSPVDVGVGRGGFAFSLFLDMVELARAFDINFIRKVSAGIELTPFFPIRKKGRLLLDAHLSLLL